MRTIWHWIVGVFALIGLATIALCILVLVGVFHFAHNLIH